MQELKFSQFKDAYRYNIDSYLLFDFALNLMPNSRIFKILDLGCGCGFVGILLKFLNPKINLNLLDISPKMCDLTRLNLTQNGILGEIICADFADFKSTTKFDFIISNPPFYRKDALNSPNKLIKLAKSSNSLDLQSFIKTSATILKPKGALIFCYEAGALQEICTLLNAYKFALTKLKFICKNDKSKTRLLLVEAKRDSKSPCEIEHFFVYENENLSTKMSEIYKRVNVKSVDL